jgi:hypothetical protein
VAVVSRRAFSSAAVATAFSGWASERSQTERSARAISAQSIGTTSRSGLAFQSWSIVPSSGSFASVALSCSSADASMWSAAASGVTCHHGVAALSLRLLT